MRLTLLTGLLMLVFAAPASADVTVKLGIQGNGTVVDDGDEPLPCDPGFDDQQTVMCAPFTVPGPTYRMRASAPAEPAGHWVFDRWDGDCLSPLVTGETAKEVCVVGGPADTTADVTAIFDDVKGPTIDESLKETRLGDRGQTVRFDFTADEDADDGAVFNCAIDGQPPADCSAGTVTYPDLAPGAHQFTVQGVDASGQGGGIVTRDFTVDAPPIPESPGPPVVLPTPTFPPVPRVLGPNAVTAKVSRMRTFSLGKVRLVCPAVKVPCAAKAVVRGRLRKGGKAVRLASKPLSLEPSSSTAVKLRLGRKVAAALRKRGRLKGVASLEIRAPDVTTRKDVAVTLRPARR